MVVWQMCEICYEQCHKVKEAKKKLPDMVLNRDQIQCEPGCICCRYKDGCPVHRRNKNDDSITDTRR